MTIDEIHNICFVGAGNMGCFNAVKAALSGYAVTLYDVDADNLQQALPRCEGFAAFLAGSGYCAAQDVPAALQRIKPLADLAQATANADLVSESVFERLDIKREVHQMLDEVCPEKTLLTTNSSYLLLSEIEDVVRRGDRMAAMHSYMGSPLVDIVGGARTSTATLDTLRRYAQSIGAVPLLLKKENPGYVLNAVLGPVLATAMFLVAEGEASCEDVDRAWMSHRCALMGPFGIIDLIGLNLVHDSWLHRNDEGPIPGLRPRVLSLLTPFIEAGELGMQSGKGFYSYPDPGYQQDGFLQGGLAVADVYEPLALALVASAVLVAATDVAEPEAIDMAWKVGTSLDTGPFAVLAQMGIPVFLQQFERHVAAGRFDPENARLVTDYLR